MLLIQTDQTSWRLSIRERTLGGAICLLFLVFLVAAGTAHAQTMSVSAVDNSFGPRSVTIPLGATIIWTNSGTMQHTVTADNGSFDSGTLSPGANFSHTFTTPGTYPYYCRFHGAPSGVGMSGTIVVSSSNAAQYQVQSTQYGAQVSMRNIPYTGYDLGTSGDALYFLGISAFLLSCIYLLAYYARRII